MSKVPALELLGVSAPAAPASRVAALHGLDLRLEPGEQVAAAGSFKLREAALVAIANTNVSESTTNAVAQY